MSDRALLESLTERDRQAIESRWEPRSCPPGTVVVREGEVARSMFFVVEGQGRLRRADIDLGTVGPGDHLGELGLIAGRPRAATLLAETAMTLRVLDERQWESLCLEAPHAATALAQAIVASLGEQLASMTDSVGALLRERTVPRRTTVDVRVNGEARTVRTGAPVGDLLPREVEGFQVVAALVDRKAVSLGTPITASATVEPLTPAHFEGERVVRESAILLLLEAAARVPGLAVRVIATLGSSTWIEITGPLGRQDAVRRLREEMLALVEANVAFREEWWTVEEARAQLTEQGWPHAVALLEMTREAHVALVSCGKVQALRFGPLVPRARMLAGFSLEPSTEGAVLVAGGAPSDIRTADWVAAMNDHARWLEGIGATSVGAFNRSCIDGHVSETIRIAEGYHEKRLGQIADAIAAKKGRVRVVCIAGPSSSGKTTFIKRLTVQLRLVGIEPVAISLDDYYVDREKTVRDEKGEYDYEALEAIRLDLLREHIGALLRGERVTTAHYDFLSGQSQPAGGPTIELGSHRVLMLEGIHGLNPALLGDAVTDEQMFRVFIQPMIALPLDAASRFSPSDLRLLRRIVRDRQTRGSGASSNILRWPSVRRGERRHIFPYVGMADAVFDTSLVYELSVLKPYAERFLLEVPADHPAHATASRLRHMIDKFVAIHAAEVPPTSLLREFIGDSVFRY